MLRKLTDSIFYGNYYIGILAILLALETAFQLHLPAAPIALYILLFSVTTGYYTYAYSWLPQQYRSDNPRSRWYLQHTRIVNISLACWAVLILGSGFFLIKSNRYHFGNISILDWGLFVLMVLAGIFYYGILPRSFFNLRNTGWLKSFTIGFTWACCVSYMPVFVHKWQYGTTPELRLVLWFFLKNWMFCTLNAIMFDIKDYEDDTNRQLKTFVVQVGLKKTISLILLPMIATGLVAFLLFAWESHMPEVNFICNLIPFLLCTIIILSLGKSKPLLYYLIVIDGVLIIKALCGILGVWLEKSR